MSTEPGAQEATPSDCLHLTTTGRRSGRPREIAIWFTERDGHYYLIAETGERASWVRNIMADPRVSWRIGRARLTGRARVVDQAREPARWASARARSEAKYGWGDGLVVELTPGRPATRGARGGSA